MVRGLAGRVLTRVCRVLSKIIVRSSHIVQWTGGEIGGDMNPADILKGQVAVNTSSFSFLDMFLTAHPVVKIVMFGLLLSSVWSWAIIVEKIFAFRRARREADKFEQMFWSGQSLDELYAGLSRLHATASFDTDMVALELKIASAATQVAAHQQLEGGVSPLVLVAL